LSISSAGRSARVRRCWRCGQPRSKLGFPGTLGAPWIDYIVADRLLIRPQDERPFSERIIRLPHSHQANDDKRVVTQTQGRSAYRLPEDAIVFCSFNSAFRALAVQPEDGAVRALAERAAARALNLHASYFRRWCHQPNISRATQADIALDYFPYGSHTTASDALWAGIPLIGLAVDTFASRVSPASSRRRACLS